MIDWSFFSARCGLYGLQPQSAPDWESWSSGYHAQVSFRTGRKWRHSIRAVGRLDAAHKAAKGILDALYEPPPSVHGFVRKRSTLTGAQPHVGAELVLSIDLKRFYAQVDYERVERLVQSHLDPEVAAWIQGCCFVSGALPFGFRTSPVLSNIAFQSTDDSIQDLANRRGVAYTRWVDDLTFSGGSTDDAFLEELTGLLSKEGWHINDAKTRFMRRSPYVLGLYVGKSIDEPHLPRWMKRRLLLESHYFAKFGDAHFHHPGVLSRNRLFGLAAYARSIEPDFASRIDELITKGLTR